MNSSFEQFEINVLQRISLFGLDFSFSNLTLYLVLAIIVILTLSYLITKSLSLIPNYWQSVIEIFYSFIFSMLIDQAGKKAKVFFPAIFSLFFFILICNYKSNLDFCQMMFSVIMNKSLFSKTKIFSSNTANLARKNYSNQVIIDNLFRTQNVIGLDNLVEDSLRHKLIDPLKNQNVSVHQLDVMSQSSIKNFGISFSDLVKNFSFNNFFINRHTNLHLAHSQFQYNQNLKLQYYHQRSNTIAETTVLQASKSNFSYIKSIDMTWNNKTNSVSTKLTGNVNPDYACCIVWQNGLYYYYHADLKNTTLINFEKKVLHLHPKAIINTNFYWINDPNFDENHTFSGITKIRLEDTYHGVIQYYASLNPNLAKEMFNQSFSTFNKFKKIGLVKDYNDIPINTPKFVLWKWIENLF